MKNKVFYLIGVAILFCYTSTFTSCINGVDDEYLDQKFTGNGGSGKDDENTIPDINGDYSVDGDYDLKMTYNGDVFDGKRVVVLADENAETATFTLTGTMKDLNALSNLLDGMNATFTTYSPIPGEKEFQLKNVKLFRSGKEFQFKGEEIQPTRIVTYRGEIKDDVMTIDLTHKYTIEDNKLLGAWKMGDVKEVSSEGDLIDNKDNDSSKSSPLFLDWGSSTNVDMGTVKVDNVPIVGSVTVPINRPMNGIFNLLMSPTVSAQLVPPSIEQALPKLIEYVVTEETGGMYASYSWTGVKNPEYSQDMSHNIMRYHFDKDGKFRIEANADYLLPILAKLLGGGASAGGTRASTPTPDNIRILGKELVEKLRPALEQGFPCEYVINGDNLTINLDGAFLKDLMITIGKIVNDPLAKDYIYPEIDKIEGLGAYATNIKMLLLNFPKALGNDCKYVKLGFRMVKTTPHN